MTLTILQGDNTAILPTIPAESVQCIVTSTPYYGLRDYGLPPTDWAAVEYAPMAGLAPITIPAMSCCLGLEPTPEAFIGHLVYVWRMLWRVLRDDGVCWLNLGDSYASCGGGEPYRRTSSGKLMPPQGRAPTPEGMKQKDMLGIPWRAAFALHADGWYLRSDVIWSKPNAMPESVTDRPTKAHEYLFLLSKRARYYYDADAIREPHSRDWWNEEVNETPHIVNERRDGENRQGKGNIAGRNKRSVWSVATSPYAGAHFAVFPDALIEPCILAGARRGDTVLDPYGGSGTTGRVALKHGRAAVLIEMNPTYVNDNIMERTAIIQPVLPLEGSP